MRISEAEFNLICQKQKKKKKKPSGPKESEIQKSIKLHLEWHGWFVVKIHQSLGSYKGIADLYAIKDGRQVWIEVKTPKGKQSEHQVKFQEDVEQHGGVYLVARSVDDVMGLCASDGFFKKRPGSVHAVT